MASLSRSFVMGVILLRTRLRAVSWRIPVGLPLASLSMVPPAGLGVFLSTPAMASALELTQMAWPQARVSTTG